MDLLYLILLYLGKLYLCRIRIPQIKGKSPEAKLLHNQAMTCLTKVQTLFEALAPHPHRKRRRCPARISLSEYIFMMVFYSVIDLWDLMLLYLLEDFKMARIILRSEYMFNIRPLLCQGFIGSGVALPA